jgi:hypothetical protein
MTHITDPRVIDNHAAMGKSPPAVPDTPFLTLENIFRAGVRRAARRREILAAQSTAQSTWDSESRVEVSGVEGALEVPPRTSCKVRRG